MKTTATTWIALLGLLGASTAIAYHVPDPHPITRSWDNTAGNGLFFNQCESTGPSDPVDPQPFAMPGLGAICYASSQHLSSTLQKQAKLDDITHDTWSYVEPTCDASSNGGENMCPGGSLHGSPSWFSTDWFARVGSNAHSCSGKWGEQFVFQELLAYFSTTGVDPSGVSGHVTFFIDDPLTVGSYDYAKDVTDIRDATLAGNCSGSSSVGLA